MYHIERAIILAAGIGKRLQPITTTVPKPFIEVNGVPMIESVIHALHANHITEIYIVVGHLKEHFLSLTQKYDGITLIENPYYTTCNNISSLYVAREHLQNVMILDGDQIIYNNAILSPTFERSGYNCVWTDSPTAEWILYPKNGIVHSCSRTGDSKGWQLYSISRWTAEDGQKLKKHLEYEFEKNNNHQIYWDDIALFCYPHDYSLGITPMNADDIVEIDNLCELSAIDKRYETYLDKGEIHHEKEN